MQFGDVYLAEDRSTKTRYAIKRIRLGSASDAEEGESIAEEGVDWAWVWLSAISYQLSASKCFVLIADSW